MSKTYAEKLRDPRWQKRRLEILNRAGFACEHCENTEEELHVHHLFYERGKEPWDYEDDMLMALCKTCHTDIAWTQAAIAKILASYPIEFLGDLYTALCDLHNSPMHPFSAWSEWMQAARIIGFTPEKPEREGKKEISVR